MPNLYNILLILSRNIFFYKKIKLSDNFETRLYLMLVHFSIMLIVSKNKKNKFSQRLYDLFFHNIENNLREIGLGDVSVNKKMKEFNKILYDILLKINIGKKDFEMNKELIFKYFDDFNGDNRDKFKEFEKYFINFYYFCFEQSSKNMVKEALNFKF